MIDRNTLAACLLAADRDQIMRVARAAVEGWQVIPLQPAESGLALLQWRDAVKHQPFYLGEVPIARAAVALTDSHGKRFEGGAVVMVDDAELAQAIAVLDAVWSHRLPGATSIHALAEQGAQSRARLRGQRQAMLFRTRVDFSLLSQTEEEEEAP